MADQTVDNTENVENVENTSAGEQTSQEQSFLSMSDAEMLNAKPPTAAAAAGEKVADKVETTSTTAESGESTTAAEGDGETAGAKQPGDESTTNADGGDKAAPKGKDATSTADAGGEKKPPADKAAEDKTKVETSTVDYKAEYERLMAPFKANGREIKIDSVDDAVALMQMGANYNKKMAALKPNLKLLKMLESNGLLSEEKIGFLIDLGKKNPAAINKLVQDSGLDPMDLSADKASAYKQTAYAVDDREIELDTVLDELQGSPTYTRTLDVVSNKWDVASKQVVSQQPQLLKLIDSHVASGIYDLISTEIERERLFGRLKGLSDIEAYRQVGDAINARGGFNHLASAKTETKPKEPVVVQPKTKAAEDDKLKDKRRAASSTQTAAPSAAAAKEGFNPLELSDAEFSKLASKKYA